MNDTNFLMTSSPEQAFYLEPYNSELWIDFKTDKLFEIEHPKDIENVISILYLNENGDYEIYFCLMIHIAEIIRQLCKHNINWTTEFCEESIYYNNFKKDEKEL